MVGTCPTPLLESFIVSKEDIDKLNISIDLIWAELRKMNRRIDDVAHSHEDNNK
jgi:hypothetical protein